MASQEVDWESWHKHVDYVVRTQGSWYGIGDADGNPLFTLPQPVTPDVPDQWMDSTDLQVKFAGREPAGSINRVARLLVTDALDQFDSNGQFLTDDGDYMLLAAFPGPDGRVVRRGGDITHTTGEDMDNAGVPATVTVHALNCMDCWNTIPAVSWPVSWWKARPYEVKTDESGIKYKQPRHLARVEMATRSTFTWKNGPAAFVIRRLAQESLDVVMASQQDPDGTSWVDDPYHVVELPEIDNSPEISLEARDGFLWETVSEQAENAGVILGAYIWWPGDPPVRCWSQVNSSTKPRDVDITPSEGESSRHPVKLEFPHAMVVMTVKEVT